VGVFFTLMRVLGRFRVVRRGPAGHVAMYRLTRGRLGGRFGAAPVLLLTTVGRKSGKRRTTPVMYLPDGARYVVVAGGRGIVLPFWYINLRASGEASIQVGPQRRAVRAETVGPAEREELWLRLVAQFPAYATHERQSGKQFPVVALTPTEG
jgi:F420H(2)-dependent quinone reductase